MKEPPKDEPKPVVQKPDEKEKNKEEEVLIFIFIFESFNLFELSEIFWFLIQFGDVQFGFNSRD